MYLIYSGDSSVKHTTIILLLLLILLIVPFNFSPQDD